MPQGFVVRRAAEAEYRPAHNVAPESLGLTRWNAVGEADGAVHTDFGISRLSPGGSVPAHVHSFEESFHLIAGEVLLITHESTIHLVAGDYGVIPIGVEHAWMNVGSVDAQWADIFSPAPRARHNYDTYRVPDVSPKEAVPVDPRDPRNRNYGSISNGQMDPGKQSQELLAVSASMRTALLVYSGISLKMMVDSDLGSVLSTMFMVKYEPTGVASPHDHPLEEAYLITDGEVDATFNGEEFRLGPGDIAWAGVGCVHSFRAVGKPVQWLETQSPQMPARHAYRFSRDWDYLDNKLTQELP